MILFLISSLSYIIVLVVVIPAPNSLRANRPTYTENFKLIQASLFSGLSILIVFLVITNFDFITVDENIFSVLSLNNDKDRSSMWPLQTITHLFIHSHPIHLYSNVAGLGLASVYERRVGAKRFLAVLIIGSLASIPSIFFYSEIITVCGISGGVFGLAAAYFVDQDELSLKEWGGAILFFIVLASMLALEAEFKSAHFDMKIDHIGHLLGAAGVILYCRLKPIRL